jgi:pyridoxal phosphate enzyme (YggS family)
MTSPTPLETRDISENLAAVQDQIKNAAQIAERDPHSITLIAVSKTHPATLILPALEAGHRVFGENRVQEAEEKWPALKQGFPDSELHLIGPLQTNKVKQAVSLFDVIETLDRPKLARALATQAEKLDRVPRLYVQVNTGEEPQKAGILPEDADQFIASCKNEFQLPIEGVMCIPPVGEEPSLHFTLLREIALRNEIPSLSMGMSADYEIAVRFGATHVRVGTAIFGQRENHQQ